MENLDSRLLELGKEAQQLTLGFRAMVEVERDLMPLASRAYPPPPEALRMRSEDPFLAGIDVTWARMGRFYEGGHVKEWRERMERFAAFDTPVPRKICQRAKEIMEAWEAYDRRRSQIDEEMGLVALWSQMEDAEERRAALLREIADTPALTIEGLRLKARLIEESTDHWEEGKPPHRPEFMLRSLLADVLAAPEAA